MAVSNRHQYAARVNATTQGPSLNAYYITDPNFKPDLRGHFTGGFIPRRMSGRLVVDMTEAQAQFHIDQGTLEPVNKPAPAAEVVVDESAPPADDTVVKKGK